MLKFSSTLSTTTVLIVGLSLLAASQGEKNAFTGWKLAPLPTLDDVTDLFAIETEPQPQYELPTTDENYKSPSHNYDVVQSQDPQIKNRNENYADSEEKYAGRQDNVTDENFNVVQWYNSPSQSFLEKNFQHNSEEHESTSGLDPHRSLFNDMNPEGGLTYAGDDSRGENEPHYSPHSQEDPSEGTFYKKVRTKKIKRNCTRSKNKKSKGFPGQIDTIDHGRSNNYQVSQFSVKPQINSDHIPDGRYGELPPLSADTASGIPSSFTGQYMSEIPRTHFFSYKDGQGINHYHLHNHKHSHNHNYGLGQKHGSLGHMQSYRDVSGSLDRFKSMVLGKNSGIPISYPHLTPVYKSHILDADFKTGISPVTGYKFESYDTRGNDNSGHGYGQGNAGNYELNFGPISQYKSPSPISNIESYKLNEGNVHSYRYGAGQYDHEPYKDDIKEDFRNVDHNNDERNQDGYDGVVENYRSVHNGETGNYNHDVSSRDQYKSDISSHNQYKPEVSHQDQYKPEISHQEQYKPEISHQEQYKPEISHQEQYKHEINHQEQYKPEIGYHGAYQTYSGEYDPNHSHEPSLGNGQKYITDYETKSPYLDYQEAKSNQGDHQEEYNSPSGTPGPPLQQNSPYQEHYSHEKQEDKTKHEPEQDDRPQEIQGPRENSGQSHSISYSYDGETSPKHVGPIHIDQDFFDQGNKQLYEGIQPDLELLAIPKNAKIIEHFIGLHPMFYNIQTMPLEFGGVARYPVQKLIKDPLKLASMPIEFGSTTSYPLHKLINNPLKLASMPINFGSSASYPVHKLIKDPLKLASMPINFGSSASYPVHKLIKDPLKLASMPLEFASATSYPVHKLIKDPLKIVSMYEPPLLRSRNPLREILQAYQSRSLFHRWW